MASNRRSRNIANGNRNFDKLNNSIDKLIDTIDKLQDTFNKSTSNNTNNNSNDSNRPRRKPKPDNNSSLRTAYQKFNKKDQKQNLENSVRFMDAFGYKMGKKGATRGGKVGKAMEIAGGGLQKFSKLLGKASGFLTVFSVVLDIASKAAKAFAETDKKQQDIQNRRNTLYTKRNIELSNVEAEGTVEKLNTSFERQMSEYNKMIVEERGKQEIANQTAIANTSARINSVIGDINNAAWERLSAQTDIDTAVKKLNEDIAKTQKIETERQKFVQGQYERGQESRAYQQRQTLLNAESEDAKLAVEDLRLTAENPWTSSINRVVGGSTSADNVQSFGNQAKLAEKYGENTTGGFKNMATDGKLGAVTGAGMVNSVTRLVGLDFGGITDAAITKGETTLIKDITNATNNLNAQQANYENFAKITQNFEQKRLDALTKQTEDVTEIKKSVLDTANQIEKMYQKMAQTVEQWSMNFQDISFNSGIGKGITDRRQLETFSSYMNQITTKLARTYGLTAQDVMQLIQSYAPGGRNMMMNESDLTKQAAFSKKYLGGDIQTAAELANNAELFNIGVSGTVDMFSDIAKKLNKMGLDGRKYMKDMVNNMKMANKFTFKDGVKGLADMAKWAQNVRFNMANVPQILDNIQSGGLENIITKVAKIQVLGGRYAMYADPLAMYYEAFNDPESLMKRFNNMTKGMGRFNKKTGNVDFNQVDQELMRAFAEASGQSIEDVRAQATYNIKKNKVTGVNQNLTGDQQQALVNKAYYENGEWMVNTIDGRKMNVKDVNEQNVGMVQGETYEDTMEKGMAKLVSFTELFRGATEGNLSELSNKLVESGQFSANMNERLAKEQEDFNAKLDEYVSKITENVNKATQVYENSLAQNAQAYQASADDVVKNIQTYGEAIVSVLNDIYQKTGYNPNNPNGSSPSYVQFKENQATYEADKSLSSVKAYPTQRANDAFMSGDGKPMTVAANSIKPIDSNFSMSSVNDAMAFGNGNPMTVSAKTVKSINDGVAKTNPQDNAIFAKTGGPFDTLFNGVFGRIDEIYNNLSNNSVVPSEPIGKSQFVSSDDAMAFGNGNPMTVSANELASQMGVNAMPTEIIIKPVKVELSGSVRLEANGQSIDLMELLNKNPMLIRQLSQMISDEVGKSINGGRSVTQYDYLRK